MSIKLSIIVPIYNTAKYLKQCIDSVLNQQDIDNIELILINDGSTDNSGEIIDNFVKINSQIIAIHQSNQGVAYSRNVGLSMASGKYIVFLDSDDWLVENTLSILYNKAELGRFDMVMVKVLYYYSDNKRICRYNKIPKELIDTTLSGKDCFVQLMKSSSFPPMVYSYIYNREWLIKEGIQFDNIVHEDELWTLKSLCLAKNVYVTNIVSYIYRQRDGSFMLSLENMNDTQKVIRIKSLLHIVDCLILFAEQYKVDRDLELKSWIYVKIFHMYFYACSLLFSLDEEIANTIDIIDLRPLLDLNSWISYEQKRFCLYHYSQIFKCETKQNGLSS